MDNQERRRRKRNKDDFDNPASIEIHHSAGPVAKSVYNVLEYDEYGLSFLMPEIDSNFRPGEPLEYSIMNSGESKVESFGLVKYFRLLDHKTGETYFKVGLENTPDKAPETKNYQEHMYDEWAAVQGPKFIHFSIGGKEINFILEGISHYSATFFCSEEDAWDLRVSSVLKPVVITCAGKKIYEGTIIVMRRTYEEGKYRITIGTRKEIYGITSQIAENSYGPATIRA